MALIKCKECGKDVSSSAKTCPNCGHAVPKKTSRSVVLIAVLAFLIVVAMFASRDNSTATAPGKSATPSAPKSVKEASSDDATIRAANLVLNLRNAARNPDSFKLSDALLMPNGAICIKYRAQNGFGGMNGGKALSVGTKFKTNESDGFTAAWNHNCVETGVDIMSDIASAFRLAGQCTGCIQTPDQ